MSRGHAAVAAALVACTALVGCSPGTSQGPGETRVQMPAPLPDLELPGLGDSPSGNLRDIEGPAVISVWATWCTPCRTEMPVLQEFADEHEGVVDLLGINFQDPQQQKALQFVRDTGVRYPSFRDADGKIDRLSPFPRMRGLPFMAFVDAEGEMVGAEFVIIDDVEELEGLVDKYLPGTLGSPATDQPTTETE